MLVFCLQESTQGGGWEKRKEKSRKADGSTSQIHLDPVQDPRPRVPNIRHEQRLTRDDRLLTIQVQTNYNQQAPSVRTQRKKAFCWTGE